MIISPNTYMFDFCHYQTYSLSLKTADFDDLQLLVNILCNYLIIENIQKSNAQICTCAI